MPNLAFAFNVLISVFSVKIDTLNIEFGLVLLSLTTGKHSVACEIIVVIPETMACSNNHGDKK